MPFLATHELLTLRSRFTCPMKWGSEPMRLASLLEKLKKIFKSTLFTPLPHTVAPNCCSTPTVPPQGLPKCNGGDPEESGPRKHFLSWHGQKISSLFQSDIDRGKGLTLFSEMKSYKKTLRVGGLMTCTTLFPLRDIPSSTTRLVASSTWIVWISSLGG